MNKRIMLVLSFFLITVSSLCAEGINWRNWETAIDEAKRTNKMIMMDVIRDNCRYCTKMDKTVFHNESMATYIEKNFIPVKVNLSQRSIPMGIKVEITPTFFFFTADQKMVKKISGSWNQSDFHELIDKVIANNNVKDKR